MSWQITLSRSLPISATFCLFHQQMLILSNHLFLMAGHAPGIATAQPKVSLSPLWKGSLVLLKQPVCAQPHVWGSERFNEN